MDGTSKKFDQIVVLFPRFSGKNQENLIRTAKSLLTIQTKNTALLPPHPPGNRSADPGEQPRRGPGGKGGITGRKRSFP
jgi:hypothetical protein